jgi:mono/diheme cytochrome c family protein
LIFLSFLSFSLLGCDSGPPPEMTDPGALIYHGYANKDAQCSRCHGDEGQGGMFGPEIRQAVQKLGVDSIRTVIINGRGKGDKRMPDFEEELTAAQIEQVIRFLQTWNITAPLDSTAAK